MYIIYIMDLKINIWTLNFLFKSEIDIWIWNLLFQMVKKLFELNFWSEYDF
jgi:hypothetical protein